MACSSLCAIKMTESAFISVKPQLKYGDNPSKMTACKIRGLVVYSPLAASFVITPLVPGSPSLDVKPHSPGETRQKGNFDLRFSNFDCLVKTDPQSPIENRHSKIKDMPVRYGRFEMPKTLSKDESTATDTYAKFSAEPFEAGYGHTVGNSLRRVLLSSLEGAAITAVKITGAQHEFATLPGVVEDVTDIVLNLK